MRYKAALSPNGFVRPDRNYPSLSAVARAPPVYQDIEERLRLDRMMAAYPTPLSKSLRCLEVCGVGPH